MNLIHLKYFQSVCKYGSVNKAALFLHISQPALSKAIQAIESELNIELFYRNSNHLNLTKEGQFFLTEISKIIDQLDILQTRMGDFVNRNNEINFGISPLISAFLFPPLYEELYEFSPNLHLNSHEAGTHSLITEVEKEIIDIAVVVTNDVDLSKHNMIKIFETEIVFCTNAANPLAREKSITVDKIKNEPLVLLPPDSFENTIVTELYNSEGIAPNILLYTNQLHTIHHFINHNIASSFLYSDIIHRKNNIVSVPLEEPVKLSIGTVWKKDRYLHSGIRQFIEFSKTFSFKYRYIPPPQLSNKLSVTMQQG